MAQMGGAIVAMHLGAAGKPAIVLGLAHPCRIMRRIKAGPACARVKFGVAGKQRRIATETVKHPVCLWEIVMGKGAFGAMIARDLIGQIGQGGAPFGIGFCDFGQDFIAFLAENCYKPKIGLTAQKSKG